MNPNEPEIDFYRNRLREIGAKLDRVATSLEISFEDRQSLIGSCRVIVDECLTRPRSNGPAWDQLEKLRGDLHSRDVDVQVLKMENRDLAIFRQMHKDFEEAMKERGWAFRLFRLGRVLDRFLRRPRAERPKPNNEA